MRRCWSTAISGAGSPARARRSRPSGGGSRRRPVRPVPARAARRHSRPLDARFLADLCRDGPHVAPGVALRLKSDGQESLAQDSRRVDDFKVLAESPIHLFITATNVRTGRGEVFKNAEVTPDVLLASACLPKCFRRSRSTARPIGTAAVRQSDAVHPCSQMQVARHDPGPDQSRRAPRNPAQRERILNRLNRCPSMQSS